MTTQEGAFAASLDADSEGEEGKFYVWSQDEIFELMGRRRRILRAHYDVSDDGNFEGHNILNRLAPIAQHSDARRGSGSPAARTFCWRARRARAAGGLDDKVLADWNGLMIAALVNAGVVLDEPSLDRDGAARLRFHRAA